MLMCCKVYQLRKRFDVCFAILVPVNFHWLDNVLKIKYCIDSSRHWILWVWLHISFCIRQAMSTDSDISSIVMEGMPDLHGLVYSLMHGAPEGSAFQYVRFHSHFKHSEPMATVHVVPNEDMLWLNPEEGYKTTAIIFRHDMDTVICACRTHAFLNHTDIIDGICCSEMCVRASMPCIRASIRYVADHIHAKLPLPVLFKNQEDYWDSDKKKSISDAEYFDVARNMLLKSLEHSANCESGVFHELRDLIEEAKDCDKLKHNLKLMPNMLQSHFNKMVARKFDGYTAEYGTRCNDFYTSFPDWFFIEDEAVTHDNDNMLLPLITYCIMEQIKANKVLLYFAKNSKYRFYPLRCGKKLHRSGFEHDWNDKSADAQKVLYKKCVKTLRSVQNDVTLTIANPSHMSMVQTNLFAYLYELASELLRTEHRHVMSFIAFNIQRLQQYERKMKPELRFKFVRPLSVLEQKFPLLHNFFQLQINNVDARLGTNTVQYTRNEESLPLLATVQAEQWKPQDTGKRKTMECVQDLTVGRLLQIDDHTCAFCFTKGCVISNVETTVTTNEKGTEIVCVELMYLMGKMPRALERTVEWASIIYAGDGLTVPFITEKQQEKLVLEALNVSEKQKKKQKADLAALAAKQTDPTCELNSFQYLELARERINTGLKITYRDQLQVTKTEWSDLIENAQTMENLGIALNFFKDHFDTHLMSVINNRIQYHVDQHEKSETTQLAASEKVYIANKGSLGMSCCQIHHNLPEWLHDEAWVQKRNPLIIYQMMRRIKAMPGLLQFVQDSDHDLYVIECVLDEKSKHGINMPLSTEKGWEAKRCQQSAAVVIAHVKKCVDETLKNPDNLSVVDSYLFTYHFSMAVEMIRRPHDGVMSLIHACIVKFVENAKKMGIDYSRLVDHDLLERL